MSILYINEHCLCYNYSKGDQSLIINKTIKESAGWEMTPLENTLLFVLEGELVFSFGKNTDKKVTQGKIALIPSGSQFKSVAKKETKLFVVKVPPNVQLCDRYSLEQLLHESDKDEVDLHFLDINGVMQDYLRMLNACIQEGLKCTLFFELKIKELFYIFRGFYTKDQLYSFFYPLLSNDLTFSDFVHKNYHKVKTVKELAALANYSLSGFVKRFKKVFGVSAYQWMKEQKANLIYHEINNMTKALKEISFEYGFSSPAHFNDFCKAHFGDTPGKIRKSKKTS
ncbi:MAG TPA: AraC family transcriptional regulator [Dysgonomonas sp.]|nr:AraC family transcriptional regulator [Dysgonomonas sp.]